MTKQELLTQFPNGPTFTVCKPEVLDTDADEDVVSADETAEDSVCRVSH